MLITEIISVTTSGDIVAVRHAVRRQAVKINLSLVDQTKIVTAASELARDMLIYGGGGEVTLEVLMGCGCISWTTVQGFPILIWRCETDSPREMEWD